MTKKVTLRRKEVLNHLPKQVRAEAVIKLSSVYVNRQPLKAFSPEDEVKYMKGYLDVSPDHMEWPKYSKEFWANLTVPVGFTGVELEIGVDENGNPSKLDDFIKYRFALKHPHVALTKDEMDKDFGKRFYIQDLTRDDKVKNNKIQLRKDADKMFIKSSADVKNMKRILRLITSINPDRLTDDQIENQLYEIKDKNPAKFLKIASDKNLEIKAEIEEMVTAGVMRKIGNQIIFIDDVIGDTLDNAVVYLRDKKNSSTLTVLRAKLRELAV